MPSRPQTHTLQPNPCRCQASGERIEYSETPKTATLKCSTCGFSVMVDTPAHRTAVEHVTEAWNNAVEVDG